MLAAGRTDVGGQAVLQGVMMRGPRSMVVAVRRLDGSIVVKDLQWRPLTRRRLLRWLKWPLVRGATVMVEAMVNGMQALSFSADVAMQDEEESQARQRADEGDPQPAAGAGKEGERGQVLTRGAIALSLALSLILGIALFIYLPHVVAASLFNLVRGQPLLADAPVGEPLFHVLVGTIKMTIFVVYILAIRRMKDILGVFQYHGAEHKSIHTWEAGEDLTVENAQRHPTFHPRCGTSFLVFVILISIFFFAGVFPLIQPLLPDVEGWKVNLLQASIKIPLMLPIAGLSYEFIKWAGRRKAAGISGLLSIPGRLVQMLTTSPPDDRQVEVALVSLKRALQQEGILADPVYENCTFVPAAPS